MKSGLHKLLPPEHRLGLTENERRPFGKFGDQLGATAPVVHGI